MKTNLNTREKDFHHRLFQRYITGKDNPNEIIYHVPIGSFKTSDLTDFYPYAPEIKYVQHDKNNCCFSSLASDLYDAREHVAEQAIS